MPKDTNPDAPQRPQTKGRGPKQPVPTDSAVSREEWAQWVERISSHFAYLMARESEYLQAHPDDKQSRESFAYYKHAVGFCGWLTWRIRSARLRPADE